MHDGEMGKIDTVMIRHKPHTSSITASCTLAVPVGYPECGDFAGSPRPQELVGAPILLRGKGRLRERVIKLVVARRMQNER